jgi:excisionase family DNA binding protein
MSTDNQSGSVARGTYTAEQIAIILGISRRKAYLLCDETKDFKVIRMGKSIRVHKESFDKWFNQEDEPLQE